MVAQRLKSLFEAVDDIERILILPHNDPDPDAVAGAAALRYLLAEVLNIEGYLAYHGIIGRAENRALVRYLGYPLQPLAGLSLWQPLPVALIDTQPETGNNTVPPGATITIVIDHHPWREATAAAKYSDVRTTVGATSTILTEYLQAANVEPSPQLATALFYGIKTDTLGLSRGGSPADAAAYVYLQPRIDNEALVEIERAQVPVEYFKSFNTALRATRIYDRVIFSFIGLMVYPDMGAEMADMLLRLEGAEWVICMGQYEDNLMLALRTRDRRGGAGALAQTIVGDQGMAGGHSAMAGGYIPLHGREPKRLASRIRRRVVQQLNISPDVKGTRLV